ncbi:response regulator transcription factor [Serratia plymuthica]|uniref:HTH luxR-type domain-containing protein n=1 Tax=Serratia plymuthica S13 TaxID=1348660 RepID=S4YRA3_SERPL|nr:MULTISPECIES: LuxR C-terminal-related transcriptional regulator [Serratia]AGP46860.1 hypothetical protein M621_05770 [Serratia plymuthica S13]AHY06101.1 hypothetical protein sch_05830 [Serratia plymuthica]ANS41601.1 Transcriptional regulatory protein UhpA [Serratia inhibens PRI-2C]KYG14955.1 DNA-binding transcriptional activator BglJ [Serratia plymuthica]QPS89678.1 response regulator transcription factor [Serratia plymuthica]
MKAHLNIVILDANRFFAMGLEVLLTQHFMQQGYPPAFFSDSYDENADLVFQSHSLPSHTLFCRPDPRQLQFRIAIQESPIPRLRLPVCFHEQSTISRRIGVQALLAEVDRLLASSASLPLCKNCPRCAFTLTARERQVLMALSWELTPQQIAKSLQLSIKTVSAHKCTAMEKLGFTRNSELYHWFRRGGLSIK